ncbi:hypothetical protein DTO006G1_664 [Penicillium roqueforti]|nr:hypothetical protein CBS147337_340 [Penicillium roqueforti]KAI2764246.1 hypothetical protein DTO006G1_664 [Penicillium roqueforti]KAI3259570.1 hypothetical protein DTO006G7_461 [Penicillium roqueforti]
MAKEIETALEKYPTVAISSLEIKDVENALNLHLDRRDKELEQVTPITPPPPHTRLLVEYLKLIDEASNHRPPRKSVCAGPSTPCYLMPIQSQQSAHLLHALLTSREIAHYGVWYGETEEVALNVVIVKAKNMDSDSGVAQALGYMGCVHRERKSLHKQDCTIYGLVTTGETFRFLKISNDSKWSTYVLDVYSCSLSRPFGLLVHIFCRAAVMSPAHSKESSCQFHQQEASADSAPLETVDKDDKIEDWYD